MAKSNSTSPSLHVMMFPYLAFGHISPFIQLTRKLLLATQQNTLKITFLSSLPNIPRIKSLLPSLENLSIIPVHLPAVPGLPDDASSTADLTPEAAELLKIAVDGTKPQVKQLLVQLNPNFVFFDFAMHWIPQLTAPLGIKAIFFSVFAAVSTAFLTVPARGREQRHGCNYSSLEDIEKPPAGFPSSSSIQSVPRYQAEDFMYIFKSFNGMPCVYDRVVACIESCSGVVIKTCMEMEGDYVKYVESQFGKPVILAGPVVPEPPADGKLELRWSEWLDGFGEKSVVFSSFGSESFLSDEAVHALLLGLEMSGLPFLVVLNFPKDEANEAKILKTKLPYGFEERVRGRGIVHTGWVQQQLILRHKSVGCFVCHAGLSSVMEGLVADCQLVFLAQKGDQYLNAAMFARDLGIGVEIERKEENGGFVKESVRNAVKKVMMLSDDDEKGKTVREKHNKWREFLLDEQVQQGFMLEFVKKIKDLADQE